MQIFRFKDFSMAFSGLPSILTKYEQYSSCQAERVIFHWPQQRTVRVAEVAVDWVGANRWRTTRTPCQLMGAIEWLGPNAL
jgi:hypothetical protein